MKVDIPNESPEQAVKVLQEAKDKNGISLLQLVYKGNFNYFDDTSKIFIGKVIRGYTVHSRFVRLTDLGIIKTLDRPIPTNEESITRLVKLYYIPLKHKSWIKKFLTT